MSTQPQENTSMFRQKAIDRLASPEQLDEMITLTSLRAWMSLFGAAVVVGAILFWGFFGSVPTRVYGTGMLFDPGSIATIRAKGTGTVLSLNLAIDTKVKKDEVIGQVEQKEMREELASLQTELKNAEINQAAEMKFVSSETEAEVEALEKQKNALTFDIERLQNDIDNAESNLKDLQYLKKQKLVTSTEVDTAQSTLNQLKQSRLSSQANLADIKNQLLKLQDTSDERLRTASDRLQNAKSARDEKLLALQQAEQIVAQFDGIVIGLSTNVGDIVQFGSPVARIRKDKRTAEIIASSFFPAGAAKKLEKGMSVQVAPDNVEVDKYGYAIGKVISVDSFPATLEEIQDLFQNSNLASNLLDSGPVIQVAVDLQEDPSTPSQLQWTSSRGPDFKITEGTLCTIAAITRKDRPVDLVIPVIKKKILGIGEDN